MSDLFNSPRVESDGPVTAQYAIVGEAPAAEEFRQGRGFVGPSGRIIWPILRRLAAIERYDCWVTNLCKYRLDDDADVKLTEEEFEICAAELRAELDGLPNLTHVLAVGALAAKALLGDRFVSMSVNNGMGYPCGNYVVVPCWHPAAALRGGDVQGKDPLAWMGAAIQNFKNPPFSSRLTAPPPWRLWRAGDPWPFMDDLVGVDTEGTSDAPECMTVADETARILVWPESVPAAWSLLRGQVPVFHNAPWDWRVLKAMGVRAPETVYFYDTMEMAYLKQTEPQGLKDLGQRYLGIEMKSWEDTVMPYYTAHVLGMQADALAAGTTTTTHSPKTGKLYKKPKIERTEEAKKLFRLKDPHKIAAALGYTVKPALFTHCPLAVAGEYATLDPWVTLQVAWRLGVL